MMPKKIGAIEEPTEEIKEEVKEEKAPDVTMDFQKLISNLLLATKRENIDELVKYMAEIGYFTAPCSGGNHLCKTGGLAEHSYNVCEKARSIAKALIPENEYTQELDNSIVIAALLHDLGKCGDYGKQMYVENILKSGKQSDAKPYKRNGDLSAVPHAIRSVKIATLYIDLTEDEEWAILCHDGLYDFMKYEMQGHETPLQLIIHWADMWACHVLEKDDKESEEKE